MFQTQIFKKLNNNIINGNCVTKIEILKFHWTCHETFNKTPMKTSLIVVLLIALFSIVFSGRSNCIAEQSVLALESGCDKMLLCETNCQVENDLACPSRIIKGRWVDYSMEIDASNVRRAYRIACIRNTSEKQVVKHIIDLHHKQLIQYEDLNTKSFTSRLATFKRVLENTEFINFWLNFKKNCKKLIKGKNPLQRARENFEKYEWKDEELKVDIGKIYRREDTFNMMIERLLQWSSGKFTPKCQCSAIKNLIATGRAPDGTRHDFSDLRPHLNTWRQTVREQCYQKFNDCAVPPNWRGFWLKLFKMNHPRHQRYKRRAERHQGRRNHRGKGRKNHGKAKGRNQGRNHGRKQGKNKKQKAQAPGKPKKQIPKRR